MFMLLQYSKNCLSYCLVKGRSGNCISVTPTITHRILVPRPTTDITECDSISPQKKTHVQGLFTLNIVISPHDIYVTNIYTYHGSTYLISLYSITNSGRSLCHKLFNNRPTSWPTNQPSNKPAASWLRYIALKLCLPGYSYPSPSHCPYKNRPIATPLSYHAFTPVSCRAILR